MPATGSSSAIRFAMFTINLDTAGTERPLDQPSVASNRKDAKGAWAACHRVQQARNARERGD